MKEPVFIGAATAIITPFSGAGIDYHAYDCLLEKQIDAGIQAIVVCGTTGEASTMSMMEKQELIDHTVRFVKDQCKVIAGIGTNSTEHSIEMAKIAYNCGADSLLAVTPYYNKCTQEGLVQHYCAIADSTPLPLITYNVPGRTGVNIAPETCKRLSAHSKINGLKEAGGNISQVARIKGQCEEDFHIWSGNDDQITAIMSLGGCGVISVLSNIYPKLVVKLVNACLEGNYALSASLQCAYMPFIDGLFSEVNPIPIKAVLSAQGLCEDTLRLPLVPMSSQNRNKLLQILHSLPKE